MNTNRILHHLAAAGLAFASVATPLPAETPDWVNYQGVLRDAAGNPRNGPVDMTFRFFDQESAGNEILIDRHTAAGTGAVGVADGLFSVALGSGGVADGAAILPGDPFTTVASMFRQFPFVWMQIEIAAGGPTEVLVPRLRVDAVPYAFNAAQADTAVIAANATALGGMAPGAFVDTTATAQSKAGPLTVNGDLAAGGNRLRFGHPGAEVLATSVGLNITGGDQPTDGLLFQSSPAASGAGSIFLAGQGSTYLGAGNGDFHFTNGTLGTLVARLEPTGNFTAQGDLVANGNDLRFAAPGASVGATVAALTLLAGDADSDDLFLRAGNGGTDGEIEIRGGSRIQLAAADGTFGFSIAGTGLGGSISVDATGMTLVGGIASDDTLTLSASNLPADGSIEVVGDGNMLLRAGDGTFLFSNGSNSATLATLIPSGDFTAIGDLTAAGGDVRFGVPGARLTGSATAVTVVAGDLNTDDISLIAGNDITDGWIDLQGDGPITLRAGDGNFDFEYGPTGATLATLSPAGMFTATNDLVAEGNEIHLGPPGSTRIVRNPATDDFYIARDEDQNHTNSTFSIFHNVGQQQMRIGDTLNAPALFDGEVTANGLDYAEAFWISDPTLQPGEVVVFDPERPAFIARAAEAYSNRLAGVISTQPGFVTGSSFAAEEAADPALAEEMRRVFAERDYASGTRIALVLEQKKREQQRPVALAGRLPVMVDASHGPIAAGDHLTSSPTPGHAMRMAQAGPSIGIALEGFKGTGKGTILAFVQRGHYTPTSLLSETQQAQARLADDVAARTPDPATGVQVMPAHLQVVLDGSGEEEARFSVFRDGRAEEPRAEVFRVDERGDVWAQGAFRPRSMDVAETFRVSEPVEPGDVLVMQSEPAGRCAKSRQAADPAVVGVVASDPGVLLGGDMSRVLSESPDLGGELEAARRANDRKAERTVWAEMERRFKVTHAAVALTGTVGVKVDAAYGAIATGDLLVASPTPGHAMRAPSPAPEGAVIGKALEPFAGGAGTIRMAVMLR